MRRPFAPALSGAREVSRLSRVEARARSLVVDALHEMRADLGIVEFHDDGLVEVYARVPEDEAEKGRLLVRYMTGRRGYTDEMDELRGLVTCAVVMES